MVPFILETFKHLPLSEGALNELAALTEAQIQEAVDRSVEKVLAMQPAA